MHLSRNSGDGVRFQAPQQRPGEGGGGVREHESKRAREPAGGDSGSSDVAQPSPLPPAVFESRGRSQRRHVRLKCPPSRAGSLLLRNTAAVTVDSGLTSPIPCVLQIGDVQMRPVEQVS